MGGGPAPRNKGSGTIPTNNSLIAQQGARIMAEDREKITDGANERAVNENIGGTAPGIPDDALAPGQELPEPPTAEEEARIRAKLGVPAENEEVDTLPLEGE
jgi:hypothetical protein